MTSTEFKIGLDGSRVSSKVLKPPGGGSSDIFGLSSSNGFTNERVKNSVSTSTQNRLFGTSPDPTPITPAQVQVNSPPPAQVKSNLFETNVTKSVQKRYVHRNPITGEEVEYNIDNKEKTESNGNQETEENNGEAEIEQNSEEEKKTEIPFKPVQTSIRVRNPPGGKSSGIF